MHQSASVETWLGLEKFFFLDVIHMNLYKKLNYSTIFEISKKPIGSRLAMGHLQTATYIACGAL